MTAKAHVRDPITAVHSVRENAAFAHVFDLADHFFISRIEHRQHGLAAQIQETAIQTDETVVGRRADIDPLYQPPVGGIEHQHSAVPAKVPVSGGDIEFPAVPGNGGSIGPRFIGLIPNDFFLFQVEGTHAVIAGGEVRTVRLEVSGEASKALLERRYIDAPNELVPLIDIED